MLAAMKPHPHCNADNWAMLYTQKLAMKLKVPMHVCFCLVPKFLEATQRHYNFMLKGLEEVEQVHNINLQFCLVLQSRQRLDDDDVTYSRIRLKRGINRKF